MMLPMTRTSTISDYMKTSHCWGKNKAIYTGHMRSKSKLILLKRGIHFFRVYLKIERIYRYTLKKLLLTINLEFNLYDKLSVCTQRQMYDWPSSGPILTGRPACDKTI